MGPPALGYVAAGALVGALVGLTGVGGGSLMTPLLLLLFGQSPAVAVGTDLIFSATTKVVATASFGYSKRIDWQIVRRLAIGSLPGMIAVLVWFWLNRQSPETINRAIPGLLGAMLAATAACLLFYDPIQRWTLRSRVAWWVALEPWKPLLTVIVGVFVGASVTLTSIGAGALGTVALFCLYPRRLPPDRLVATDIAHALPVTVCAGIAHASLGHLNSALLGWLLLGSIPTVLIASRLTLRIPGGWVRACIALMLVITSFHLLAR